MNLQKSLQGVTLLEIMLVLAIAASLFVFGIGVYNQFKFQANEQKILATVNQVFQALEGYYYANCRQTLDASSNPRTTGTLDPLVADNVGTRKVISIANDLITPGFIASSNWRPNNPLLDNTPADNGYYVQFDKIISGGADRVMNVYVCSGTGNPPSCTVTSAAALTSGSPPSAQTRSIHWMAQVAVKLSTSLTSTQWTQIKNDLNADCLSNLVGSSITPCSALSTQAGYVVWTRSPSAYNAKSTSDLWTSTPYVVQFNNQYTNDPMATLSGVTNETQTWYNPNNYLCGG